MLWFMWSQIVRHDWATELNWTERNFKWKQFKFLFYFILLIEAIERDSISNYNQFSSPQSLSCVRLFATPWIAAHQASLSITNSQSSLRLAFIELVMPSIHLILGRPLLLLPPITPSIRVFSNESALCIRWPGVLQFMGSQRVGHDWATELNWTELMSLSSNIRC